MNKIMPLLKNREFLIVATVDASGQPHAVPKFFLKFDQEYLYLIDYMIAKTVDNLRANPKASIGLVDIDNLEGYRINGSAELIENGNEFEALAKELDKKLMKLSVDRVIDGSKTGKKNEHYELEFPEKFVAIKFKIEEVTAMSSRRDLYKEIEGKQPQTLPYPSRS